MHWLFCARVLCEDCSTSWATHMQHFVSFNRRRRSSSRLAASFRPTSCAISSCSPSSTITTSEDDGNFEYFRKHLAGRCPASYPWPVPCLASHSSSLRCDAMACTSLRTGDPRKVYGDAKGHRQTKGLVASSSRSGQRWRLRSMRDPGRRIAKLLMGLKPQPGRTTLTAHISNVPQAWHALNRGHSSHII